LLFLPAATLRPPLAGRPELASLAAFSGLLSLGRHHLGGHPAVAERAALLALAVAQGLDPRTYGHGLASDCRAGAAAALAESRLARGDLGGAREALALARRALAAGSGDPYAAAEVLEVRARLLAARGHAAAARRALRAAVGLLTLAGDPEEARALEARGSGSARGAAGAGPS
jgi:hypothetical protein